MEIPNKDEYWYAGDGELVKILKVSIRSSNGRWSAFGEIVPTKKKRLIRDYINPDNLFVQKRNLITERETDSRKILRAYLGGQNENRNRS